MAEIDDLIASLAFGQAQKQLVAESDPYSGGASVADAISNLAVTAGPQYKTRDKIILGALSGLTGGLFSGASQDYQGRAQDAYVKTMTDSITGLPQKPSVLNDTLFRNAKEQGNLFRLKAAARVGEEDREVNKALRMETAKELGKLNAYGLTDSTVGDNPLNPLVEKSRAEEKAARDALRGTPMVNNFQDIKSNFDTLTEVYKFNDKPSTLAFVSSFARILDPGSVVREGEIKNAENTQSFLSGLGYSLDGLTTGLQTIGPEAKQQMVRAASAKFNKFGEDYTSYVDKQRNLVKGLGGKSENVFGPIDYKPFNFLDWANNAKQTTVAEDLAAAKAGAVPQIATSPDVVRQLAAIRDQLKDPSLPADARAILAAKAQQILSPAAPSAAGADILGMR
jgi:hypothetical protein